MSRWDYDVVFYRVFCITLLGLAFTFTVILTNVFIDIDGVILKKKTITETTTKEINTNNDDDQNTMIDFDDTDEDSDEPMYRTKRSIESERRDTKNIGYKKILTSRLASLLEELEKEETTTEESTTAVAKKNLDIRKEELLHLAIHNILLQGIIEHKDLNGVYKKVHEIVKSFNNDNGKNKLKIINNMEDKHAATLEAIANSKEVTDMRKNNPFNGEHKFINEIINCKQLEKDIEEKQKYNDTTATRIVTDDNKDKTVFIKTVIEINEPEDKKHHLNNSIKENVEGLIKFIYNGKSIEVKQVKDDPPVEKNEETSDVEIVTTYKNEDKPKPKKLKVNNSQQKQTILNKLIEEYINMHPVIAENAEIKRFKTKRLKRQIKIRYLDEGTTTLKPKSTDKIKDDDDLYIEIETHYDGKGIIGEKKKKLVRSLIAKIQKALHSDMGGNHEKSEDIKFIKRTQDPIDRKTPKLLNKMEPPLIAVEKRQLDPIDKTLGRHDIIDNLGDTWKKEINGPRFLSITKSVNSAEMGEINVDYDNVLKNGIPKRLQMPLNADVEDEDNNSTYDYTEPNNVTLFLKDIDGSGFSIGINQYVGGPPDKDSMKMFNGLENLLSEYHNAYDRDMSNESNMDNTDNFVEGKHDINKREVNDHKTARSLTEVKTNYKSSYTTIFRNSAFPVQKYINIFKKNGKNINDNRNNINYKLNISNINVLSKKINIRVPLIIKTKVFNKNLSSSKNISRGKRSINVKKISNMKSKIRLNRYLNTKAMAKKRIFLKNNRSKRQIGKIRIIERDHPQMPPKNSDENIFLISRENTYSNVREINTPQRIENDNQDYDDIFPLSGEYRIKQKNINPANFHNVYDTRQCQNNLMSKYPHIFMDARNGFIDDNTFNKNEGYRIQPKIRQNIKQDIEMTTFRDISESKVDEIVNAILPSLSKTKYKVTVKVSPKNTTNIGAGFKEIHTSVNKSFDENGLRYFSLVNVSKISKIEKLNETRDILRQSELKPLNNHLKTQQKQIKTLLELHKKRVDQQLESLLRESQHLEQMIEINSKNNISKVTNILQDDVIVTEKNNDKIDEVLDSIKKLQETYKSTKDKVTVTTERAETKLQLIDTIKTNERITYEILKKIDLNTHILTNFLQMFAEKLTADKNNKTEANILLSKEKVSDINKANNNTVHIDTNNNNNLPLAIYGHPDINVIENNNEEINKKNQEQSNRRIFNESRFFMDEIENDFKIVPNNKQFVGNINANTTLV